MAGQTRLERPQAWLTTVVTRLAIDAGRRQQARRETYVGPWLPEPVATDRLPEESAQAGALLGLALLRLMDRLDPEDRAVFVLREAFDVPYDEIAECVGRSPAACRQVVSRTRAAMRTSGDAWSASARDVPGEQRRLVTALINAVRAGDVEDVVRLVSEDCVLWADGGGAVSAARRPVAGADAVARFLLGVAGRGLATADLYPVAVNGGDAVLVRTPTVDYLYVGEHEGGRVTGIQVHANPVKLGAARLPARPSA